MEQGEFNNLPGKGRPVDTSENPFEDPELRMAHRFLRNAGFSPAWIEERKNIDADFESTRTLLARASRIYLQAMPVSDSAKTSWQFHLGEFRESVVEFNKRIQAYNLRVSSAVFQRRQIDCEREIERILERKLAADEHA